ncbi:nucleoside triphosphate pyrophosphohydrolase [Bacteroidales bacterium OttesenSCG-928-K03]|nr:nucleoside triphosphate pyrophosphohydrolase [Odoribacter sp. OttesenSCG-928-L07]MDL2239231.1 nucleoside triphosphate pyrophosphohydrolase [Bacteroidales bacterium OttesenSCG-928-L14]MDL2240055.1 nucleoside triphosphate pyrophosphohydrolase [Bacteroidales bacterium OttesenSCG-928-K22]MDL2242342.1 nucleoside triphosphate pyrophosphohydrolase [Bacteroidales bacterium OttesenSCG-928-K03]
MKKTPDILFRELLDIMDKLRAECPWDKKQDIHSLRHLTIEETYELADAIIDNDYQEIKNELGDILLHIVFYAKIGSERSDNEHFDISDVIESINEKLIRRHPHIFSDINAETDEDVKVNWEKIKLQEKDRKSVLSGVPTSLPSLIKAYRIQDKVHGVGFDWENVEQVWDKVEEEIAELQEELKTGESKENIEMEFGDLLFALINYARFIDVNPETALEKSNKKFIARFTQLEKIAKERGKSISDMTLEEMENIWQEVKKKSI